MVIISHLSLPQPIMSPPHCVIYGCFLSLLQIWWLIIGSPALTEPFNTLLHLSPLVLLHRKLEKLIFVRAKGANLYCAYRPGSYTALLRSSEKISSVCLQVIDCSKCVCQSIYGNGNVGVSGNSYMWMWACLSVYIMGGYGHVYQSTYGDVVMSLIPCMGIWTCFKSIYGYLGMSLSLYMGMWACLWVHIWECGCVFDVTYGNNVKDACVFKYIYANVGHVL